MSKLNWWRTWCATFLLCTTAAIALPAQTFTTLHSFDDKDGAAPNGGLIQGTTGKLYGTTYYDGGCSEGFVCGTVFSITPSGAFTTLYEFCTQAGCHPRIAGPLAGLIQGTDGSFYGTASSGGTNGDGAVFKITPDGVVTTLYNFCAQTNCLDGDQPRTALVQGTDGNFYGTTYFGGTANDGTIFSVTPSGVLTTLHSFCSQSGCTDGVFPIAGLIQANDGNFYGTTPSGGANDNGTVFRITRGGTFTTLYSFCVQSGCSDGNYPVGLIQAIDGDLYGTSTLGGSSLASVCGGAGCGTVFKITTSGTLTTLYSFCPQGSCEDGQYPKAGLVQATDGNFYGTTQQGGGGYGTVFQITPSGALTTLYSFCSQIDCWDGEDPGGALVQDTNGILYGTTYSGGTGGDGTVFSLSVGLGPFVETQPAGGKVGAAIKILGTNLTGATSVTFNGTPTTFTVEASSVIKATVPAGATTGTVQVVTPSGTLSSNVPFRVAP